MANPDGWIFWYNQRWFEYTGTTTEQMEGWQWKSVHDPEILPMVLERWKASIESGQSFDMTFPLRGADKVYRPFLTRVVPVRDYQGKITRWFGTNTDISEQSRAEDELRQRESQLRTMGDNLPEGALYRYRMDVNNEAHMEFISAGIERMTGVPAAEFMADTATAISNILSEDMGRLNAAIATSREQLTRFEVEVRHKHRRTGEVHWSLMRSTPSRRPDGSTFGMESNSILPIANSLKTRCYGSTPV
jgi:PAS domain S-box-containing protein